METYRIHKIIDDPNQLIRNIQTLVSHLSILLKKNTVFPGHMKTKHSRFEPSRQFFKQGEMCKIVFNGQRFYLKYQAGLFYIAYLLTNPNKYFVSIYLADLRKKYRFSDSSSSAKEDNNNEFADEYLKQKKENGYATQKRRGIHHEQIVDHDAVVNYYNRLTTIDKEIAEAKKENDHAAKTRLINEKNELLSEISMFHRKKKFKRSLERARQSVGIAISRALEAIKNESEELWRHLANSIKRGTFLVYVPEDKIPWIVSLYDSPKKLF